MHTPCSRAPRRARPATALTLATGLLVGLVALVAPAPAPVGAVTATQTNVGPNDATCRGSIQTTFSVATCSGIDITSKVLVNGVDVAANSELAVDDLITVSVSVAPESGNDAMYRETGDTLWNASTTAPLSIQVGLPTQTGTLLSEPTSVQMSRTDNGDRGSGPGVSCAAQADEEPARSDPLTSVAPNSGTTVGTTRMEATLTSTALTARWRSVAYDRCVGFVSNNGIYAGMTVQFQQRVLRRDLLDRSLTWDLGGLELRSPNGAYTLSWGSARRLSLALRAGELPAAPLRATATPGDRALTLAWSPPDQDGGLPITGYLVGFTSLTDPDADPIILELPPATRQWTISGLAVPSTWTAYVAARNDRGDGPVRSAATTQVTGRPGQPTSVNGTGGISQAGVTWSPPLSDGGEPITGYQVRAFDLDGTLETVTDVAASARSHTVTGLTNGRRYLISVSAVNRWGAGIALPAEFVVIPTAWWPHQDAASFIRFTYGTLGGRTPTAAELTTWTTALTNGTADAVDLIEGLHRAAYWDGTLAPIVRLYRAIYLRDPDTAGLRYWEGEIRSGRRTINQMANFVAGNQEFRTLYGTLGNAAFVDKVYDLVLGRPATAADRAYWVGELNRGQPRGRMVLLFSSSPEYRNRTAARVTAILLQYGLLQTVVRADVDRLVALLGSPITFDAAVLSLLRDPRYEEIIRK